MPDGCFEWYQTFGFDGIVIGVVAYADNICLQNRNRKMMFRKHLILSLFESDSKTHACGLNHTLDSVSEMLDFLIDNVYAKFGDRIFRQEVGITIGTDCAPLPAGLVFWA